MHFHKLLRSSLLLSGAIAPWLVAASDSASDVIELTSDNFEAFASSEGLSLIEFFAPWCGHCKALAPHYEESATALKEKNIKLAKVDCVDQAELCQENGVSGYPTLKVYKNGSVTPYNGPRQADGIISYMVKQSLPAVSPVTAADHETFTHADKLVLVAYVDSDSDALVSEFNAAADAHRDDYLFGLTTDAEAIKAAGVSTPAVVLYKSFDEPRVELSSAKGASSAAIIDFVKSNAIPLFDQVSGDNYQTYASSGLPLAYLFVDPEDPERENYIKELTPIAKQHKGAVNFVWIDAVKFVEHAKGLTLTEGQWPALVIQDVNTQHKYPLDQSVHPSHAAVSKHVEDYVAGKIQPTLKSQPIPEEQTEAFYTIVGKTFEDVVFDDSKDVFVQFSAPWCGHCKRLLPTWETLATTYAPVADKLVIAKMDATENDLPPSVPFHIQGFPTLKFKPAGSREFVTYEGDRSLESLREFVEAHAKNDVNVDVGGTAGKVVEEMQAEEVESAKRPAATEKHDEL